jgi:hypothetical protein
MLTRASEMLLPNRDPRVGEMSILSDRIGKPRLAKGMLLYLASVALVAAATIILFSVASISLLDTSNETLKGSRIDNSPIEDKFIGTVVSYTESNAAPVPVQESTGFYGSAASPGSHPPLRHATSRRPGAVEADRDNIADKLNRAVLSRLLEGKRALRRAPLR